MPSRGLYDTTKTFIHHYITSFSLPNFQEVGIGYRHEFGTEGN